MADLRAEYEAAVRGLRAQAEALRRDGRQAEEIARAVHAGRRALAAAFKARTPEPLRARIYARTLAAYGDPLGPTVEQLRARGKDWEAIIESALRPGPFPFPDQLPQGASPEDHPPK